MADIAAAPAQPGHAAHAASDAASASTAPVLVKFEGVDLKTDFSDKDVDGLGRMRSLIMRELPDHEVSDIKLVRFLRARKYDVEAAVQQYIKQVAWRKRAKVDDWEKNAPMNFRKLIPEAFFGFDKEGNPGYIVKAGKINPDFVSRATVNDYVWVHIWGMEYSYRRCEDKSKEMGKVVDKFSNIVDLEGLSAKHRKCLKYIKAVSKVDERNYPESMAHTFIINAPWIFSMFWKVIRPVLDPVTASKVFVLGSDYKTVLAKYYDPEYLPVEYGGTAKDVVPICSDDEIANALAASEAQLHLTDQLIKAGQNFEIRVRTGHFGGSVMYYFATKGFDIKFGITFEPDDAAKATEQKVAPLKTVKYDSHKTPVKDFYDVHCAGTVVLKWDNGYSFFKDKHLSFTTQLTEFEDDFYIDEEEGHAHRASVDTGAEQEHHGGAAQENK